MSKTKTASSAQTIEIDYEPFAYDKAGLRMGWLARLRYCALVVMGKRRDYPICICAFGRDDDDD